METLTLLLIAGAVMSIILGGAYFTCQRVQDYCALQAKREELAARILNSRLGKMLRSLNISLSDYLHKCPETAVTDQLATCQNCGASTACDSYLADDRRDADSAREFCPNMNEFNRLRDGTPDNTA